MHIEVTHEIFEERKLTQDISEVLDETSQAFIVKPVNETYDKLAQLRDAEYRIRAFGKALNIVYLTIAIATPILTINELSKISKYVSNKTNITQSIDKR